MVQFFGPPCIIYTTRSLNGVPKTANENELLSKNFSFS